MLVNPSLLTKRPDRFLLPVLQLAHAVLAPASPATSRSPARSELAYDRIPVKAAYQLSQLWVTTRADLGKVTQPLLVLPLAPRTTSSSRTAPGCCCEKVASTDVREVMLENSYHVATLDNDAPLIFEGSLEFVRRLAPATGRLTWSTR